MGGRDSPRPNVVAPGDETWTTVGRGPRNVSVDPKKLKNIKVIYLSQYTKHNSMSVSLLLFYIQYYIYYKSNSKKQYMYAENMIAVIAPAGFWPRGQNPRRHHCSPRVNRRSTYSMNIQSYYRTKSRVG